MMRFPLLCVAALCGLAVSAAAQDSIDGARGRHPSPGATLARHLPQLLPVPSLPRVHVPVVPGSPRHAEPDRSSRHRESPREPHCAPAPRGHWETVCEQVLVPGYWRDEHVPPTYGWVRGHCGRLEWGMVDPGGCRKVWVPPHYEHQTRQVWVPDCEPRRRWR